jgi:hypothetical protein
MQKSEDKTLVEGQSSESIVTLVSDINSSVTECEIKPMQCYIQHMLRKKMTKLAL